MEKKLAPTDEEMNRWRKKFRQLSNSARYREAHELSKKLVKQYPSVILFAYYEAVMTAEQEVGFSKAQVKARQKLAAKKLRKLLYRARAMTLGQRNSMRNEYYWFSRQPHKQYRLGLERVKAGEKSSYYSQGVGAEQVAKNYALRGRKALCLRWAKKSEKAWLNYFKVMPDWYNSYLFYAASLGYQGKIAEMDKAFATGAKIAGKTKKWKEIVHHRKEVMHVRNLLESSSRA